MTNKVAYRDQYSESEEYATSGTREAVRAALALDLKFRSNMLCRLRRCIGPKLFRGSYPRTF